ncbi:MAG TPA: response regulator [Deltaproteobacteria bacterium]|nr:response regulator [Deltaproteobacteria bacterium]
MKTLIVEDDFTSRLLLQQILNPYGECHIAKDGKEAIEAYMLAWAERSRYDLICLDIMMPEMDGQEVLKRIRTMEDSEGVMPGNGVRVIMTTCLKDKKNVFTAFNEQCDAYLVKPIDKAKMLDHLHEFGLI